MVSAPIPPNEGARLEVLRSFGVLDTDFEKDYDDLCQLAAAICETPIALISLIDSDRQWFKASVGLNVRETPRDLAFCAHAIWQEKIFEVPDASTDERFADNPLVIGDPDIRFYAGMPLITSSGLAMGTLCAIDRVPRSLKPHQKKALDILARQVVTHLELRRALVDLQKLNDDKDRFFSIIAHDLRSPFSGLLGLVDIIHDQGSNMSREEILKYVEMIRQSIHHVYELSENLLKWALLEQGKMNFQPEMLSVAALFDEVGAPTEQTLRNKNLDLSIAVAPGLEAYCDRNMVETALRNLMSNAIKFTPEGGKIFLEGSKDKVFVRLSVRDTGQGLDTELLAQLKGGLRVVSRKGTEGESGTGLGLTLARQFAARHGGRIEIDSAPGRGTTATLCLPNRES